MISIDSYEKRCSCLQPHAPNKSVSAELSSSICSALVFDIQRVASLCSVLWSCPKCKYGNKTDKPHTHAAGCRYKSKEPSASDIPMSAPSVPDIPMSSSSLPNVLVILHVYKYMYANAAFFAQW